MSDIRVELTSVEAATLFREVAETLLVTRGSLTPEGQAYLEAKAKAYGVHPLDVEPFLQQVISSPSVQAAVTETLPQSRMDTLHPNALSFQKALYDAQVAQLQSNHEHVVSRLRAERRELESNLRQQSTAAERGWERRAQSHQQAVRRWMGFSAALFLVSLGAIATGLAFYINLTRASDDKTSLSAPAQDKMPSVAPPSQAGHVLVVSPDGGGDYDSIAHAIKEASPGECILVRPGVYTEDLTLDKNVNLIGDGPYNEIVVKTINQSCIYVAGGESRVEGMKLQCSITNQNTYSAVLVNSGKVTMINCDLSSSSYAALSVVDGAKADLVDCRLHNSFNGVSIDNGGIVYLTGCQVSENTGSGIVANRRGRLELQNCQVHNNKIEGLSIRSGSQANVVQSSLFYNSYCGALVDGGGRIFVNNCSVYSNLEDGILLVNGGRGLATQCIFCGNRINGIGVQSAAAAEVRKCQMISNGSYGFWASSSVWSAITDTFMGGNKSGAIGKGAGANVSTSRDFQ